MVNIITQWDFWSDNARSMFGRGGNEVISKAFKMAGFDSISFTESGNATVAVLNSTQIKSATGNDGRFNANNSDIRYSKSQTPPASRYTPEQAKVVDKLSASSKKESLTRKFDDVKHQWLTKVRQGTPIFRIKR